jgi:hypothetical protein
MPVILEEFGGKLPAGARADLYSAAFDAFAASARRGGAAGGVLFWDLYASSYAPLDRFGGGYGNFIPPTSAAAANVLSLVAGHAALVSALNAARAPDEATCYWGPPPPLGAGCASLTARLQLGAMPWNCLPGEPENLNSCAPPGSAAALFRNPPPQWRGKANGSELPVNAVEALVMGSLVNNGSQRINLRGGAAARPGAAPASLIRASLAWLIVPFSRGVQTKYEGEWLRLTVRIFSVWGMTVSVAHWTAPTSPTHCRTRTRTSRATAGSPARTVAPPTTLRLCSRTRATHAPAAQCRSPSRGMSGRWAQSATAG